MDKADYTELSPEDALRALHQRLPSLGAGAPKSPFTELKEQVREKLWQWLQPPRVMRSRYRDRSQIAITVTGKIPVSKWSASALPQISNFTRVYKSFKPEQIVLTEMVRAFYREQKPKRGKAPLEFEISQEVPTCADVILTSAFSGSDNCFPNAPTESSGVSGEALVNNKEIGWPTINGGIDMTMSYAVKRTVISRMTKHRILPEGFDPVPYAIEVEVRANLFGPTLR